MVLGGPVLLGGLARASRRCSPASARVRPSTRSSTPDSRSSPSARGRNSAATSACTSSVSIALQTDGPLHLRVDRDRDGVVEVRRGVHEHVADARRRVHHRHRRVLLERVLQPLSPARDDEVDHPVLRGELAQLVAVAAADDRDRALGHARPLAAALAATWASTAFECAAVDDPRSTIALPGLQAQRRAVDGHVRPRLVDHRHHAERHAHAPHVEPVLEPVALDRLAHRVRQRRDRAHVARRCRPAAPR